MPRCFFSGPGFSKVGVEFPYYFISPMYLQLQTRRQKSLGWRHSQIQVRTILSASCCFQRESYRQENLHLPLLCIISDDTVELLLLSSRPGSDQLLPWLIDSLHRCSSGQGPRSGGKVTVAAAGDTLTAIEPPVSLYNYTPPINATHTHTTNCAPVHES